MQSVMLFLKEVHLRNNCQLFANVANVFQIDVLDSMFILGAITKTNHKISSFVILYIGTRKSINEMIHYSSTHHSSSPFFILTNRTLEEKTETCPPHQIKTPLRQSHK